MQRLFSAFPDGAPGIGLAILRIAVATATTVHGIGILAESGGAISTLFFLGVFAAFMGLVFLVGFLTPIIGSMLALGYLADCICLFLSNDARKHADAFSFLYVALMSLALALIGPGAFSVDARIFGRVEIMIPERRRPTL